MPLAFPGYEYHLGIPPNQRRIRVWYSSKSTQNARMAFCQINAKCACGILPNQRRIRVWYSSGMNAYGRMRVRHSTQFPAYRDFEHIFYRNYTHSCLLEIIDIGSSSLYNVSRMKS